MKHWLCALAAFWMILLLPALPAWAEDSPRGIVSSEGGYLTEEELSALTEESQQLADELSMNVALLYRQEISGASPMTYADDYYDETFGINTDGVAVLLVMDTHDMWLSTSGQAILYFDDTRIQEIHDSAKSYLRSEDYSGAARAYFTSLRSGYQKGIPKSNEDYTIDQEGNYRRKTFSIRMESVLIALLIGGGAGVIVAVCIGSSYKMKKPDTANSYLNHSRSAFRERSDRFLRTYTSRVKINTENHSSGGGGGSSTHTSSSGGTHGGGGSSW